METTMLENATTATPQARIYAEFITDEDDIGRAQRLRYEVFCTEYNIELAGKKTWQGLAIDAEDLDEYSLHLVVRKQPGQEIIGYTRVLTTELAARHDGFYSDQEFELNRLLTRNGRFLEIGRTCIHPDYRNGATIAVLWSYLANYMQQYHYQYLFGCASVSLADGGQTLASIMPEIRRKYLTEPEFQTPPRNPIKGKHLVSPTSKPNYPALLKAYLRIGAQVCGEPCWDPEFNVADLLVVLDLNNVASRYAKHFLKSRQAA